MDAGAVDEDAVDAFQVFNVVRVAGLNDDGVPRGSLVGADDDVTAGVAAEKRDLAAQRMFPAPGQLSQDGHDEFPNGPAASRGRQPPEMVSANEPSSGG